MLVRFGLYRDGQHPAPVDTAVGEITVGPRGLLRLLESDLGIAQAGTHAAEDVARYRSCLDEANDLTRFYHASFGVDPVGVARTLLEWRREWYLHGWDGAFPSDAPPRLGDLAAVEKLAAKRVPPGFGERIRRVLALLDERNTQIDGFDLLDPLEDLPPMWRRLARRLGCREGVTPAGGAAAPGSDLGKLQALLGGQQPAALRGDGSLLVVRGTCRDVTAQAVAEALRGLDDPQRAVVIASRDGIVLDNALERVGLPRAGFQHYSPFRAASQVVKLALALVWEPLDPHRLLQFLIHPLSPLPWKARTRLAQAVAAQPGIGGPEWRMAMAALQEHAADTAFWTAPERYAAADGAPVVVLVERVRRCAAWLGARLAAGGDGDAEADERQAVFRAAYGQAAALARTLEQQRDAGVARIAKVEVDRLVDEVTRPLPDETTAAGAGHVPATQHPGNVAEPVEQVFWWDLAPARLDLTPTFSRQERAALASAGVALPTAEERIATQTRAWQRAVLNCRQRLVLVVHDDDDGARHPLWARVSFMRGASPSRSPAEGSLRGASPSRAPAEGSTGGWAEARLDEALLQARAEAVGKLAIPTLPLDKQPLPRKRRWWRIGEPLRPPEKESYSSLAKAYYHPHQWVLDYHARLRGSRITGVADGPLLYGSLAHRLFERFFEENESWRTAGGADVQRWLGATLDDLIEKEGAVLLEHGRGVDRQQVTTTLERCLFRLLEHLQQGDVVDATSEQELEKAFTGGVLRGYADLVLERGDGARAVLDAKWGSEPYRQEEINHGRHLQLAVYGFLLQDDERWPASGYYIVTTGNVLAAEAGFFPEAWRPEGGESALAIWRRSLATRKWRLEQFARGEIEVNAGAEPDAASTPPTDGLNTSVVDADRFDNFTWLTGLTPSQ